MTPFPLLMTPVVVVLAVLVTYSALVCQRDLKNAQQVGNVHMFFWTVSSVADRFTEFDEGKNDIEFIQVFGTVSGDNVSAEFDEGTKGIQVFGVVSAIEGSCG